MPIVTEYADCISVDYHARAAKRYGRTREFPLALHYLNGTAVGFSLVARRRPNGTWKVTEALLDKDAPLLESAVEDFAALRWCVFPGDQRGRKLPPVVALWEEGGLVIAAVLPPEYGGKELPLAEQERWFDEGEGGGEPPDRDRLLCWWPDPRVWNEMKGVVRETAKVVPVGKDVDIAFYTFSEWFARPDLLGVADRAAEYAQYVRRIRTMLYFCRVRGLNARVKLGNVKRAEEVFVRRGLDAARPSSWAAAAVEFDPMPEFVLEEKAACGSAGTVVAAQEVKAAVGFYSHFPGGSSGADCVGALLQAGSRHLCDVLLWPNPLLMAGGRVEDAVDGLWERLEYRGVREVSVLDGVLPFEVCSECGGMALRVPTEWVEEPVRAPKVGRNDPCLCGSGLKYKKCCGRPGAGSGGGPGA